ncbi:hypothetical protein [Sphingomonas agri]
MIDASLDGGVDFFVFGGSLLAALERAVLEPCRPTLVCFNPPFLPERI